MKKVIQVIMIFLILISSNFIHITAKEISNEEFFQSNLNKSEKLNDPPYPASNPDPLDSSTNINLRINLSWTGGDPNPQDIVTYNIFFGTISNPPNLEVVYPINKYNPGLLEYNTQYYWRIDSYDDNGGATTGPTWTFTTKDDTPPFIPSNPSPLNESIDVEIFTNISWTGGDPDGDNVTYDIYFSTSSNPPNVMLNYENSSYYTGILEYNVQYYWRIDAWDIYGYSTTGPTWTFTTKDDTPPFIPSNPSPLNESIDVEIFTNISWTGGDPDGDNVTYDIYFGTSSNPPNVKLNYENSSYYTGILEYNVQYYWRIDAWDIYGYSTTGPTWTFTTKENPPPFIPYNPIPGNGSTNIYIDAILSWTGEDPDGDNVTYDIYFGINQNPIKVISNQTINYYEPEQMETTTIYYWRIVSWDSYDKFSISPLWNFKTSIYTNSPPDKPNRPSGPTTGRPGISYSYSSSTTDSNGEPIFYMFDWDDGTRMEWIGPFNSDQTVTVSHTWRDKGSYAVKVKAKDIYGGESFWSDPLSISMPKYKKFNHNLIGFNLKNLNIYWFIRSILN